MLLSGLSSEGLWLWWLRSIWMGLIANGTTHLEHSLRQKSNLISHFALLSKDIFRYYIHPKENTITFGYPIVGYPHVDRRSYKKECHYFRYPLRNRKCYSTLRDGISAR